MILDERPIIKFKISREVSVGLNAPRSPLSPQNFANTSRKVFFFSPANQTMLLMTMEENS